MAEKDIDEAIRRVQQGDREQFSGVVESYHVHIRAFICAMVQDRDEADDLAQQTFVFAFQHVTEYQPDTNCLAWLKAIARNRVRDYQKRNSQRRMGNKQYQTQEIARKSSLLAGSEDVDHRLEKLECCVERLPENQREFLRTVFGRTSSLEDVAAELGRSGTAVRKNLSRLYERLRACMEGRPDGMNSIEIGDASV